MSGARLYTGPTKLILAFDIGTTYSSVSYCILEPRRIPEILAVARFPAQGATHADSQVPSLLYYDKSGTVRAAGAEVLASDVVQTAQAEGWMKAESWKLHLRPKYLTTSDLLPFPSGKSVIDILTDFIKYLFDCCKSYIQERHPTFSWSCVGYSIEYILTYPGEWVEQQYLYRQAIERAGLVPGIPEGQHHVHLLTEGEAGLRFCISRLDVETANIGVPQGVVVIDAGGGVVGLSMFSIAIGPRLFVSEEIAPVESRLQGSVFVTHRARALIKRKLDGWEHFGHQDLDRLAREFDQTTKLVIDSDKVPAYIRVAGRRTNSSRHCISSGQLRLLGEEATSLFNDSVDAVIDAFELQRKYAAIPITTVFLVGGLSTNDWFFSRLRSYFSARNIDIRRPDIHTNKVVADGAVLSHVSHAKAACTTQGVGPVLPVKSFFSEYIRRNQMALWDVLSRLFVRLFIFARKRSSWRWVSPTKRNLPDVDK